ncbi:MAG: antitermination protein NusG [Gammaproteobacteria bacterium]
MIYLEFLARWAHVLFGITWIGLLYYFNFVQGEYFKEATADAKSDALQKLAPRALWWFRWGAMLTFLTGLYLLAKLGGTVNGYIAVGALAGTIMFLNVWIIIWPAQKIVCGIVEGDAATAAPKAGLASRTNTLLSGAMLMGMLGSKHGIPGGDASLPLSGGLSLGVILSLVIVFLLAVNGVKGKMGPMASVAGVSHCSIALAIALFALMNYV